MNHSKVAIITGSGRGIGAEIALRLLAENFRIVIADLNFENKSFDFDPSRILFVKTDVKQEKSVKNLIQKTIAHFGRIDALINNAGIVANEKASFERTTLKIWNDYIGTNLTGPYLCTQYAVPHLKKNNGNIVNISSTRAIQSEGNNEPYAASKGGLISLTHELAVTLGPQIRVNCISPGWINSHYEKLTKKDHEQHPAGRVGTPEDVAHMVAFLISDQASFITGQNFIVDGGMTVKMIYH